MENPADPEPAWRSSSKCPHCSKMLGRKDALERHICTMHKEHVPLDKFKYKCDLCPTTDLKGSFVHKQSYDEHMTAHCGRFKCRTCGRTYKNKKGLVAHEVTHTEKNKLYQCDLCPTGFASLVSFNIHLRTQHPESATIANDRFLCELCPGIYSTRRKLELHVANSHQGNSDFQTSASKQSKSKAFKCSLCSANFKNQSKLVSHRMSVHNKRRGRPRKLQRIQNKPNNIAIIDDDTTDSEHLSSAEEEEEEEEEEDSNNELENVVKSEPEPEADPFIVPELDSEMGQNVDRLSGEDKVEETVDLRNTEEEMTGHDVDKSPQNIELICEVCSQCFSDRMTLKSHRYAKHLLYEIYC